MKHPSFRYSIILLFSYLIIIASVLTTSCNDEERENKNKITILTQKSDVTISIGGSGSISIDWGDKTEIESYFLYESHYSTSKILSHSYNSSSQKTITITGNITYLECVNQEIIKLDVSNNPVLKELHCGYNQLKNLDVSRNTELIDLGCYMNLLTDLNVSNNNKLAYLNCHTNLLKELDLSNNVKLYWVLCGNNFLSSEALNELFGTLHNNDDIAGRTKIISIHNNSGTNNCDRSIAENKGWVVEPSNTDNNSISDFLSLLDLSRPGLEKVKDSAVNTEVAITELLAYYRARTSVKHPVDRSLKMSSLGNYASAATIEIADNALKHIFIGQSAYPPYFCGDDIDWGMRPVPDDEWVWQLNRMGFWDAMAQAYWHTGDEKYAKEWVSQLTDWVKKNPLDQAHAYAWRSIEAGIRGHSWTALFQHFLDAPSFTPDVLVTFMNSCFQHANYLMTRYTTGSNWALMEAEGMAFIAFLFPEFKDSEKWKTEAIRRLNIEIDNQVYSDGHQRELSIGYHLGCISWFDRTLDLAKMNGVEEVFPASYRAKIEKMCEVPMKLGLPDGSNTQFGDSFKGNPGANFGNLREWAEKYNRPDFLYFATEGKEGEKPKETAFAYKESGLYSMRSSWDKNAVCLVLKCGPDGGWHCQPDNGTFELYAGGRHLMPDAGCYIYSGDEEDTKNREWFRQTKVHQTLTLDGKNTIYTPRLLLWQPGDKLDVLVVENAGYTNLTHRRAVFFVDKAYFIIVDEAIGDGTGDVNVHFQFTPGEAIFDFNALTAQTVFMDGWNVLVQNVIPTNAKMQEEEGQVSFEYLKKEPRPAFSFHVSKNTKENDIRFVTIVTPYVENPPVIKVEIIGNPKIGSNRIDLKITTNGESKQIGYNF